METAETQDNPSPQDSNESGDLSYDCPRCKKGVVERYYGPCESCRGELRVAYAGESRDVEAPEYEPKMNVTPNAVASKE